MCACVVSARLQLRAGELRQLSAWLPVDRGNCGLLHGGTFALGAPLQAFPRQPPHLRVRKVMQAGIGLQAHLLHHIQHLVVPGGAGNRPY